MMTQDPNAELFYVFLNMSNLICFNNVTRTGVLTSAAYSNARRDSLFRKRYLDGQVDYLPFVPNERGFGEITPFVGNVISNYRVEYDAEVKRRHSFPLACSRLSAVFAFGDYQTCVQVSEKHKWNLQSVREFRLEKDDLTRVTRVNMEVVSLARASYRNGFFLPEQLHRVWQHYWSGGGSCGIELPVIRHGELSRQVIRSDTIWEHLIEGSLVLIY